MKVKIKGREYSVALKKNLLSDDGCRVAGCVEYPTAVISIDKSQELSNMLDSIAHVVSCIFS